MKQLLRELGHAINDSVSDSDRISEAISNVRAAGFDIVLKLDATIGLARRQDSKDAKMTTQDRRFLESLHIRVDEEILEEEAAAAAPKIEITAQDIKFLKSLKISFDEELLHSRICGECRCVSRPSGLGSTRARSGPQRPGSKRRAHGGEADTREKNLAESHRDSRGRELDNGSGRGEFSDGPHLQLRARPPRQNAENLRRRRLPIR
jgi:hypothetical protein